MKVELYETQLALVDKIINEGAFGKTREEVLIASIAEHARYLLAGGGMFDMRPTPPVEANMPQYGKLRFENILQPVTGIAVPVYKGEVLRIMQVEGGQCVDFNAYNLHDYREELSCGASRQQGGHRPGPGYIVWTKMPRGRPIYAILQIPETCKTYIIGHRCNAVYYERFFGFTLHPNCQDTFAEAIRAYGLSPDDTHESFNLWMNNTVDAQGRSRPEWNPGQKGDCVDFLALFDTLAVPIICGGSDMNGLSNFRFAPIAVQIFAASQSTSAVAEMVNKRWSNFKMQQKVADFKVRDIRTDRELKLDPHYKPDYLPVPKLVTMDIDVPPAELNFLRSLIKTGQYGTTEAEAIRASFMRWCNATRLREYVTSLAIR